MNKAVEKALINNFEMNDKEKEMFEQMCKQFFEIN